MSLNPLTSISTSMRKVEQTETISILGNGAMRVSPLVCGLPSDTIKNEDNMHSSFLETGVMVIKSEHLEKEEEKGPSRRDILTTILFILLFGIIIFLFVYLIWLI
mmetsp:Transcript_18847/g.27866  ORF Transcript_18847/g.27866 Transcript_18847/m.27866 type:complete len:105 (+) Transcript_18847:156-470(+)